MKHKGGDWRPYDADWRKLRQAFLAEHPLCVMCAEEGRTGEATVVDHIVAIADEPSRRLDATNLRPLCKPHHDQRTAREQGFARSSTKQPPRPVNARGVPLGWL